MGEVASAIFDLDVNATQVIYQPGTVQNDRRSVDESQEIDTLKGFSRTLTHEITQVPEEDLAPWEEVQSAEESKAHWVKKLLHTHTFEAL